MGGRVQITTYAREADEARVKEGVRAAFDRIAELEQIMSDYRPTSEVSRLSDSAGKGWVKVSPELARVLAKASQASAASGGAFDVTAGPVIRLWREARRTGRMPGWTALKQARALADWTSVEVDTKNSRVRITKPGVRLDLGGIAKGFACDEAIRVLDRFGLRRSLVEAGGDMAAGDAPPDQKGWKIEAEAAPGGSLVIRRAALSTSGDAEQFALIHGVRYSHIVDPRTGFGLTTRVQATVLSRWGLDSDPLATALCVAGPVEGARIAKQFGARAWFIVKRD